MTTPEDLIPDILKPRVGYGLYGGREQYYIKSVDGSLAMLGKRLPDALTLERVIKAADLQHAELVKPQIAGAIPA